MMPAPSTAPALRAASGLRVVRALEGSHELEAYRAMRRRAFVEEQGLFARHDLDDADGLASLRVLVALSTSGDVLGGVRLHAVGDPALGWWQGGRLVCSEVLGLERGAVGAALVHAAVTEAGRAGALRFDAHVQARHAAFFVRLGWEDVRGIVVGGAPHRLMRHPVGRIAGLAAATKAPIGPLVAEALGAPTPWLGDDGVPVPRTDGTVACLDAILPGMVERDPEWAGWCGMLVTAHDLAAMGAAPLGALDALGAADAQQAARVVEGLKAGAERLRLPILGGHTQLGVAGALSVCGLGLTQDPVPASGGRAGDELTVTADLGGSWRAGYARAQWDSSTGRTREELSVMLDAVRVARPRAAKDVSMAGVVGTTGMLAEASGCGAELDVERIVRPVGVDAGDWLTCFPGFAMVTADAPGAAPLPAGPAVGAACGTLTSTPGVRLRWPDGDCTTAVPGAVTGLGAAPSPTLEEHR